MMATTLARPCRFCKDVFLAPSFSRVASRLVNDFHSQSKLNAKSLEEIKEDDIRADLDETPKKRVKDYSSAELEQLCDISRLPRQLRAKMSHRAELLPPIDKNAATIEKQRMLYASLGQKSGLPPGIMWPSRSQLKFAVEDEKTYFATLQEMIQVVKNQEEEEKLENKKRQDEITLAMKDMPSLVAEFEGKMKAKQEAEREAMAKKAEMLEEARDFFGYAIEENDDRIVKFLEEKDAKEKERERAEKRALKQAEAKRQLEELAKRATEEALKMAAQDAEAKERAKKEAEAKTMTTEQVAQMVMEEEKQS